MVKRYHEHRADMSMTRICRADGLLPSDPTCRIRLLPRNGQGEDTDENGNSARNTV